MTSCTARRHSSLRRHCITQRHLNTATQYAGQLVPESVLNIALIALPLVILRKTPFVDVAYGI